MFPHFPQLVGSLAISTQAPLHFTSPGAQASRVHALPLQRSPGPHAVWQLEQC